MRIVIVGAGDLGTLHGWPLVKSGEDVTFIARGARLQELRAVGVRIQRDPASIPLPTRATDDPSTVGTADLVLFCVKTYDLESAAQLIRPVVGPDTAVIPIQNGVQITERLAAILGEGRVMYGTASRGIMFGEGDGTITERARRIESVFKKAGDRCQAVTNIHEEIWAKFAVALVGNGLQAAFRLPHRTFFGCPESRALVQGTMFEMIAVAKAEGVTVQSNLVDEILAMGDKMPVDYTSSMYRDLLAGRRLELEDFQGAVVRLGKKHGIPTPLNFAIYAILKPFANGKPAAA